MKQKNILFIDRDGTIIVEPEDKQIDSLEKLELIPNVIPALLELQQAGFLLVMISNQDGLGTDSFPEDTFKTPHQALMNLLASQGICFSEVLICPHLPSDNCDCRKPKLGLVMEYLRAQTLNLKNSYVIGDRQTDLEFANNMGIHGLQFGPKNWEEIKEHILTEERKSTIVRNTNETNIEVTVDLNSHSLIDIQTGIGFFDHMLEQLAKHGGFSLAVKVKGDLEIDDHHTVEDTALTLGQALIEALGNKLGIGRYGFLLPMDDALTEIALDLGGRPYFVFEGDFHREQVGELSTELVPHFFRSLSESLQANIHIRVKGDNTHHMVEAIFKGFGRALKQAIQKQGFELPTTKGML